MGKTLGIGELVTGEACRTFSDSVDHFSEARTHKDGLVAFKIPQQIPDMIVLVIEVFLK